MVELLQRDTIFMNLRNCTICLRHLNDSNFLYLWRYYHELAESGEIPRCELEAIAYENNEKY